MNQFTSVLVVAVIVISISTETLSGPLPQLIPSLSFKDGTIAVDFLGFHAGVGVNNILNGGGLHAEAGTPFGQKAAVGLSGALGENGQLGGQLYAGATAGGNIKAAAGLGGAIGGGDMKANGGLYSAASAGSAKFGASLTGGTNQNGPFGSVNTIPSKEAINLQNSSSNSTEKVNYLNTFFAAPESATNGAQQQKSYLENLLNNPISSLGDLNRYLGK